MATSSITPNTDQRLFVIALDEGHTCFGFDNCYQHARQLADLLQRPDLAPAADEIGTLHQYGQYQELTRLAGTRDLGTYFEPGTPEAVKRILESFRQSGRKLRLFLGDTTTGRDWLSEQDVLGYIGRSGGALKVPLLLDRSYSSGGGALLTANIVRIVSTDSRRDVYRHPLYQKPELTVVATGLADFAAEVRHDDQVQARFKTPASAHRWVKFMRGERMAP